MQIMIVTCNCFKTACLKDQVSLTDKRSCRKARGVSSDKDAMQLKDTSRNRNLENAWRPVGVTNQNR